MPGSPAHDNGGLRVPQPLCAPSTIDGDGALDLNAPYDDSPEVGLRCHESLEAFDFRESTTDPNAARQASDPVAATAIISDQGDTDDAIEIDNFLFLESSTRADVPAGGLLWPFDHSGERTAAMERGEEVQPAPPSLPRREAQKASRPIRPAAKAIRKRKANAPAAPPLRSGSDGDQKRKKRRRTRSPFKPAVDTSCSGSSSTATAAETAAETATTTAEAVATGRERQISPTKPQRRRVVADPAMCDEYYKMVGIYRAFESRARDKLASIDDQKRTAYTSSLSVPARQMLTDALGDLSSLLQTALGDTTQPAQLATGRQMSVGGIRRRIRALKPVVERLCDAMTWRPPTADTTAPDPLTVATETTTTVTTTPPASPQSSDSGLSSAIISAPTSPASPPSPCETLASVPPTPSPPPTGDTPQLAQDLGVLPSFICRPVRLTYDDIDDREEDGRD